jgi:ElaB/YqjD/DUF883 family membrane-anchored ribosome-binding protein
LKGLVDEMGQNKDGKKVDHIADDAMEEMDEADKILKELDEIEKKKEKDISLKVRSLIKSDKGSYCKNRTDASGSI